MISLINVDLPHPELPVNAIFYPGFILIDISFKAFPYGGVGYLK